MTQRVLLLLLFRTNPWHPKKTINLFNTQLIQAKAALDETRYHFRKARLIDIGVFQARLYPRLKGANHFRLAADVQPI